MAVSERDPEADGATAGPRIRLDCREIADGVYLGAESENFCPVPHRPWQIPPEDPHAAFWRRLGESVDRQRELDYWLRRWLLLALLVAGSLLMVAATHG